jgi:hypothetical protein
MGSFVSFYTYHFQFGLLAVNFYRFQFGYPIAQVKSGDGNPVVIDAVKISRDSPSAIEEFGHRLDDAYVGVIIGRVRALPNESGFHWVD